MPSVPLKCNIAKIYSISFYAPTLRAIATAIVPSSFIYGEAKVG